MPPEDQARQEIDAQLAAAGWEVQDHRSMNLSAPAVAVREFPLVTGFADYMLYLDGKAVGVVEAKAVGHTLTGVEIQSEKYTTGLPDRIPAWSQPLPFAYESTGAETQFTNTLEPEFRSRLVFTFHRPEELRRLATLDEQLRLRLRHMPPMEPGRLWPVQHQAVRSLEASLARNRPRALIQMATGSGKTFTACAACYRLIKHAGAKRILFLVDRNNLGRQTLNEFQRFQSPGSPWAFTEEYNVQHLRRNTLDPACKVVITTIQRLYSILKGEEEFDEANEDGSLFEAGSPLPREPAPVVYNPALPPETFDFVIVDECHRSIYNVWRQVLEYFDAFLVGLTATPTPQTLGFFRGNLVQDYSHEKAVADGVNVGYSVYRIRTRVSEEGGSLKAEAGVFVPHRDKRTREKTLRELEDDLTYTANQLDRDVVAEDQIRLVVRTFRDRLFKEIFPGRSEVPKTLVFAKQDTHADDIVRVMREEFGKGNEFCQKITSKTTGVAPEDLLSQFRNSYHPRIAVTVDMIATGTDVKPLECLLFMRNVSSASYFEQMKGRGVRIIGSHDLRGVTPDALTKTHFVIVDAVGVCERDKTTSRPLDRRPGVPLDRLLQTVAQGIVDADVVSALGARMARLERGLGEEEKARIAQAAGGKGPSALAGALLSSLDPDQVREEAAARFELGPEAEPTEEQWEAVERGRMAAALRPFLDPGLREAVLEARRSLEQVLDESTRDELLLAGYDAEALRKAQTKLAEFREFIEENKEEIEALQILYSRPYRAGLRFYQIRALEEALKRPPLAVHEPASGIWSLYQAVEPEKVKGRGGKALVDLVALVRHALEPEGDLVPLAQQVEDRYQEWLAEKESLGIRFTPEQRAWLDAIKDHIASSLSMERDDFDQVPFNQMGGLGKAYKTFGEKLWSLMDELNRRLVA